MSNPNAQAANARSAGAAIAVPSRVGTLLDWSGILAAGVLPFALVLYLGLKGGGYDAVVRGEVGVAVWWIVLIGAATGLLPLRRIPAWTWAALAALLAFAGWTALGIGWSESSERSLAEVARVLTLLGILAVAVALQGRDSLRRVVGGVAAAIALLGVLALGSRLDPGLFPAADTTAEFLPAAQSRLNWPLNYWNGLAALLAIGIPLLLCLGTAARTVLVRSLSAGIVPALALAAFFTLSRGGAIELAAALLVLVALSSNRAGSLPTWGLAAGGSALLIGAATQRDELLDGLANGAATTQGEEMLALTIVTCLAVALLVAACNLAFRSGMVPAVKVPGAATRTVLAVGAVTALIAFLALGGPGALERGFEDFKSPALEETADVSRFESVNGSQRWQFWGSALDANATSPLNGIGPGTYEFWWAENGSEPTFIRDAHSLYLEVLAELGVVGLLVLAAFLVALMVSVARAWSSSLYGDRKLLAGVLASMCAFLVAAAIDWAWELTILPVCFLLVAAAAIGVRRPAGERDAAPVSLSVPLRVTVCVVAVIAIVVVLLPTASNQELRASQDASNTPALLPEALDRAVNAEDLQPFAGSPPLQRALVLEQANELEPAAAAAEEATRAEPTNWRTWFVLARIEAAAGDNDAAIAAFERARDLNPRSPLFAEGQ